MKILFFASFRERLSTDVETLEQLAGIETAGDLLTALRSRGEPWASTLDPEKTLIAINQEIASLDSALNSSDEVAFFPPVTGG